MSIVRKMSSKGVGRGMWAWLMKKPWHWAG